MERMKAILLLTAAMAFALSPVLSTGFNGFRADQFPYPQVDAPVQPAGYAFSIWGLIYLALLAGAGYGLFKRADDAEWDRPRWPMIVSLTIGAAWIPVAQISPFWATVLIWIMLITAIWALLSAPRKDHLWLLTPIALYAGWLTAASSVSLGLMLAGHGVTGQTSAAVMCLAFGLVIAATIQSIRPDSPAYAGAVIWALIGVAVANLVPLNIMVAGLCVAGIFTLAVIAVKGWQAVPRA
jgi:hypothetical protein